MTTITDNSILLDEAQLALREMRKLGLDAQESLESIDSYVNRVRTVRISGLLSNIIETKLTEIQKQTLKDFWFNDVPPDDTAKRLGVSLRSVYSARTKAQEILKDYLEPLITYLRDMPSSDVMPAVINEARSVLRAENTLPWDFNETLKNIRLTFGAEVPLAASALGISEKELIEKEKLKIEPTLSELKTLSGAFGAKIIVILNNGNGEIKWVKH